LGKNLKISIFSCFGLKITEKGISTVSPVNSGRGLKAEIHKQAYFGST
jgi:hypothetical protein